LRVFIARRCPAVLNRPEASTREWRSKMWVIERFAGRLQLRGEARRDPDPLIELAQERGAGERGLAIRSSLDWPLLNIKWVSAGAD